MFLGSYGKCTQVTKTVLLPGGHHSMLAQGTPFSWTENASTLTGFLAYFLACETRFKIVSDSSGPCHGMLPS